MTVQELLDLVLADIKIELHPLHRAMFEECCENAVNNEQGITDVDTLVYSARVAFLTCNSMFKNTIKAALEYADVVTYNYRGLSLVIDKNSPLVLN